MCCDILFLNFLVSCFFSFLFPDRFVLATDARIPWQWRMLEALVVTRCLQGGSP